MPIADINLFKYATSLDICSKLSQISPQYELWPAHQDCVHAVLENSLKLEYSIIPARNNSHEIIRRYTN